MRKAAAGDAAPDLHPDRRRRPSTLSLRRVVVSVHGVTREGTPAGGQADTRADRRAPAALPPSAHRHGASAASRTSRRPSSPSSSGSIAATLRRDLSRFGTYGTRGTGYEVPYLLARVDGALALDRDWPVAIVGIGNLGRALAHSRGFRSGGFRVAVLVDVDPAVVGTTLDGIVVEHARPARRSLRARAGAHRRDHDPGEREPVRRRAAVAAGVLSILNFAPGRARRPGRGNRPPGRPRRRAPGARLLPFPPLRPRAPRWRARRDGPPTTAPPAESPSARRVCTRSRARRGSGHG